MAKQKRDPEKERLAQAVIASYGARTADDAQEALRDLLGPMIEAMMRAELDAHLGYPSNDKSPKETANRRNGTTPKTVRTGAGEVRIDVPRDRDGTFEPEVVPKGSRDVSRIEERVLSMYARGMSQRDIAETVREIYGFSMSAETVSNVTDAVLAEQEAWASRELEPVYAFVFVDCLFASVRKARRGRKMAVYVAIGYTLDGVKDVLGVWVDDEEGAQRWVLALDELRQRGVEEVLFLSADGLSGMEDAVAAVFPDAVFQRCVVHLVRNSCKFVPTCDMKGFCDDARAFYAAPSLPAAEGAWEAFRGRWSDRYPGAVRVWERSIEQVWQLYSYGADVRRIMYTTNAVESVNASFRKAIGRRSFPDEDAVRKLLYLRVKELYRKWGTGCHIAGWARVRSQLLLIDGMEERIGKYL